jgi:hypothetical protein
MIADQIKSTPFWHAPSRDGKPRIDGSQSHHCDICPKKHDEICSQPCAAERDKIKDGVTVTLRVLLFLVLLFGAWPAFADATIAVLQTSADCTYFQLTNSSPWYAVPPSDRNYAAETATLLSAFLPGPNQGLPIGFLSGNTGICGFTPAIQAVNIHIGAFQ